MIDILNDVAQRSANSIRIRQGDYQGSGAVRMTAYLDGVDDNHLTDDKGQPLTDKGLWYCGRCRKPKQIQFSMSSGGKQFILAPRVLCTCEQEKETQYRQELAQRSREIEATHSLTAADKLMLRSTFAEDKYPDSRLSKIARDYVRKWATYRQRNMGLYIFGDVGVGKTFYASCIANDVAKVYGCTVKAISITTALNELFSTEDKARYISRLVSYDLLILDDFGSERRTEYTSEQIFSIIDERYKTQKPLIVTSNRAYPSVSAIDDIQQHRIDDRVRDMCVPVECKGSSKRGLTARLKMPD